MRENVGGADRVIRGITGPGLMVAGLTALGARRGRPGGLSALVGGALLAESALTKVCPLNALLGIETSERRGTTDEAAAWSETESSSE